jgi:uncharacterized protein YndB with AHSA1/START domain
MTTLSYEMVLPVQRDKVWWAWTTEEGLAAWLCQRAEVQPFVGGQFELFLDEDGHHQREPELRCQVLSIDHPRLLQLSWHGPGDAEAEVGPTEVKVELFPALDGTRLAITHACSDQLAGCEDSRQLIERMWIDSLERLQEVVQSSTQRT